MEKRIFISFNLINYFILNKNCLMPFYLFNFERYTYLNLMPFFVCLLR